MHPKSIYEYTDPMLDSDEHAEAYREAAADYNAMALAQRWATIPVNLRDALMSNHGEHSIRTAIDNLRNITNALADGYVSMRLCKGLRQKWQPLSRCPKCYAIPLADDGEHRVLCERCNVWYDVRTKEPCEAPNNSQPAR